MKKLISLLLALMMALSLSAGAFAEDTATDVQEILDSLTDEQKSELLGKLLEEVLAELAGGGEETDDRAADIPAYASFGEHLQAFAGSLNLSENDIQVDASSMGQNYTVVVGDVEGGFYGKLLSAGTLLGLLKVDNEAVYLSNGSMAYGVKVEEIQKLMEKLSSASAGGILAELGITPEQLQADAMKVVGWAGALFAKVQPAFSVVQVSETERKATVDAAAFAEAFVAGIDEILAGEDFAELFDRYYGLVARLAQTSGSQLPALSADDVKAAWDGAKGQLAQMLAQVEMELTLRTGENEYGCSFMAAIPTGTGDKAVFTLDGVLAQDFASGSASYCVASQQNPEDKLLEGTAAYQLVGTGVDVQITANFQGQTIDMNESVRVDMEKTTYSIAQTITVNGQTYYEMNGWFNWSNFNFDITEKQNMEPVAGQGAGIMDAHLSFDGVVLSMEIKADGQEVVSLNIWGEEVDANNWVLHVTIDQNGQRQAMDLEVSIVPMDPETANEPEVLAASVVMKGDTDMTVAQLTVGAVAKSGAEIDPETVMWLDADTIEAMLQMMLPQQPAPSAPYDRVPAEEAPEAEEAPAEAEAPAAEEEAPAETETEAPAAEEAPAEEAPAAEEEAPAAA